MKVTKTSTQPTFQPIELKITIESKEDMRNLLALGEVSSVIRTLLQDSGSVEYDAAATIEFLLDDIVECL